MAKQEAGGLKTLSYAYRDIPIEDFEQMKENYPDPESMDFRFELESDLIYLGTFGLNDPLRDGIYDSISYIKFGTTDVMDQVDSNQVNIRMVTGDHIETAKAVALQTGIIK